MAERETKDVKAPPNLAQRTIEEVQAIAHTPKHHKETHGTSDDIDEDTPVQEVKGPGVFHRLKEEVEAIVQAVHPKKKESPSHD
uniref:Uncharacterized protein n=1 Tax=Kalanchoe fedtschenkoi TaxID=63787 RepID=A0A7N0VAH7_KALFE